MQHYLKTFYLSIGILTVIIFIGTGQYLSTVFPDKTVLDLSFRVMLRSRHIFILLSGLVLSGMGVYFRPAQSKPFIVLQILAFVVLVFANALFVYSFFNEVETK